ncbi:hypothetical protein [Spirosoma aerophilum]
MKTYSSTSAVTRCLFSFFALTTMVQLVGCQPTEVKPTQAQPAQVHIAPPVPIPTVVCLDGCPEGIVKNLPYLVPEPAQEK